MFTPQAAAPGKKPQNGGSDPNAEAPLPSSSSQNGEQFARQTTPPNDEDILDYTGDELEKPVTEPGTEGQQDMPTEGSFLDWIGFFG
jgi:hypothetical protein